MLCWHLKNFIFCRFALTWHLPCFHIESHATQVSQLEKRERRLAKKYGALGARKIAKTDKQDKKDKAEDAPDPVESVSTVRHICARKKQIVLCLLEFFPCSCLSSHHFALRLPWNNFLSLPVLERSFSLRHLINSSPMQFAHNSWNGSKCSAICLAHNTPNSGKQKRESKQNTERPLLLVIGSSITRDLVYIYMYIHVYTYNLQVLVSGSGTLSVGARPEICRLGKSWYHYGNINTILVSLLTNEVAVFTSNSHKDSSIYTLWGLMAFPFRFIWCFLITLAPLVLLGQIIAQDEIRTIFPVLAVIDVFSNVSTQAYFNAMLLVYLYTFSFLWFTFSFLFCLCSQSSPSSSPKFSFIHFFYCWRTILQMNAYTLSYIRSANWSTPASGCACLRGWGNPGPGWCARPMTCKNPEKWFLWPEAKNSKSPLIPRCLCENGIFVWTFSWWQKTKIEVHLP
jgi:hypothetical protein